MSDPSVFDKEAALKRMANSPVILAKVIGKFKEAAPSLLSKLETALGQSDPEQFHRAAHSLKGAALNLEASQVIHRADALEQIGKTPDLSGAQEGLEALRTELNQLLVELERV